VTSTLASNRLRHFPAIHAGRQEFGRPWPQLSKPLLWEHLRINSRSADPDDLRDRRRIREQLHLRAPRRQGLRDGPGETWQHRLNRLGLDGWSIAAVVDEPTNKSRPAQNSYMQRALD
jgi:hypothetical protein